MLPKATKLNGHIYCGHIVLCMYIIIKKSIFSEFEVLFNKGTTSTCIRVMYCSIIGNALSQSHLMEKNGPLFQLNISVFMCRCGCQQDWVVRHRGLLVMQVALDGKHTRSVDCSFGIRRFRYSVIP